MSIAVPLSHALRTRTTAAFVVAAPVARVDVDVDVAVALAAPVARVAVDVAVAVVLQQCYRGCCDVGPMTRIASN